ncbi:MAG: hypothetical protein ISP90_08025 [Nevskia sp.]|nr:hypothetical protein [Nevskia sp.]
MRVVLIVAVSAIAVYCGLNLLYPRAAAPVDQAAVPPPAPAIDTTGPMALPAAPAEPHAAAAPQPGISATPPPAPPPAKTQPPAPQPKAAAADAPPAPKASAADQPVSTAGDDTPDEQPAEPATSAGPWWAAAGGGAAHLALLQADEAGFEPGIALLFSAPVSAQAAARHIRVLDRKGRSVGGQWQVSADNPRMMLFAAPRGTYTLALSPELADAHGSTLGTALRGAVTVH